MAISKLNLQDLIAANAGARLNSLAEFEVIEAGAGIAKISMEWNDNFTQYSGHLHAGMIAALLDTACGFAAATEIGNVTASHFSMNCLRPAIGRRFLAVGTTVRVGKRQVFAKADLLAEDEVGNHALVATGETIMIPLS